ncbi:MAG: thiol:disulfide interchange protein DsbA/DsbL [Pseudohongiellaceae bacterium]|nr:thiol:disulfide interchange protein DsbA/DsbL [Pseudohongiellaceae bacterium]
MHKRIKQLLAVLLLAPLAFAVVAQPEKYVAGTHYTVLPTAVKTNDPSKIEVVEVFWYGCSHCFRFEPLIENWEASIPADVDFVRFPGMWNDLMKIHAQVFYAAEALGKLEELHSPIFDAINIQGNRLATEQQIAALFAEHGGVSAEEFSKAFNSFSVRTKVNQAEAKMREYQVRSTPNMVVNGKYLISTGESVRTQEEMLEVVDFLVNKERTSS